MPAHKSTFLLFFVAAAQIGLLTWVHRLTTKMRKEWPRVVKATPAEVHAIQTPYFWGPVNAIIPYECREMEKWQDKMVEDQNSTVTNGSVNNTSVPLVSHSDRANSSKAHARGSSDDVQTEAMTSTTLSTMPTTIKALRSAESSENGLCVDSSGAEPSPSAHITKANASACWTWCVAEEASALGCAFWVHSGHCFAYAEDVVGGNGKKGYACRVKAQLASGMGPPTGESLENAVDKRRRLGHEILIQRCNETMHFRRVSYWHQYFAMVLISRVFWGDVMTAEELHQNRIRAHYALIVGIIVCFFLKYSLKVVDICAHLVDYRYVQLWNQGRTTFDRALESALLHGVSIIYTLAMQMTLCTLFASFWRQDHFIMSFLPGVGFSMFGLTLVVFCIFMVVDRLKGYMAKCGDRYVYCFWFLWALWMIFLTVPMIGYCVYSVNFMWRISEISWLRDEDELFSNEFQNAMKNLARATGCFLAISFVDFLAILTLDYNLRTPKGFGISPYSR
jgi:hypothetical protein